MIVFLSCVKTKRDTPCAAKDMYISPLFRYSYQYAKSLNPRKIYILSAKYGLLEPDDIIEPYEQTLKNMSAASRKRWGGECINSLKQKGQNFAEEAVFLCGDNYRKDLLKVFPNHRVPIKGISFGNQLKFYKTKLKK